MENSSNPGFVEISRRMGLDNEYDFVKKFGFGEKTGIDLPGESKAALLFKKSAMGELEQATVAFGQGLSVTPIQLVTAFSAIINGGTLLFRMSPKASTTRLPMMQYWNISRQQNAR